MPKLRALYTDLFSGGKNLRSKLIQEVGLHLKLKNRQVLLLSQTIEFIHHASLLHDDLVDKTPLRRSKKAAWLKYSPKYAVLAGDYLLARVMVNLSKYGHLPLIQYTAEVISQLIEGEWMQDSLLSHWDIDIDRWNQVHHLKTSSLFKWCLKAPFFCLEKKDSHLHALLEKIGSSFGLLFQRSDDLLDFNVRNYEKKAVLGDLKSGYINSFGIFLRVSLSQKNKKEFQKIQNLEDLYSLIGGKEHFDEKVLQFDKINQKMIDECEKNLFALKNQLLFHQQNLVFSLLRLLHLLYWRKAPPSLSKKTL